MTNAMMVDFRSVHPARATIRPPFQMLVNPVLLMMTDIRFRFCETLEMIRSRDSRVPRAGQRGNFMHSRRQQTCTESVICAERQRLAQ